MYHQTLQFDRIAQHILKIGVRQLNVTHQVGAYITVLNSAQKNNEHVAYFERFKTKTM